jgi:hypothetical protein
LRTALFPVFPSAFTAKNFNASLRQGFGEMQALRKYLQKVGPAWGRLSVPSGS